MHIHLTTKVPKSQNPLTVSNNNNLNVPLRPVFQHLKNLSSMKPRSYC